MIRHCDAEDVVATVFNREPCGRTYDDVDRSTVCPHEYLSPPNAFRPRTYSTKVVDPADIAPVSVEQFVDRSALLRAALLAGPYRRMVPTLPVLPPLTTSIVATGPGPDDTETRGAMLSRDGLYRYALTRIWDLAEHPLAFVMLNPSTADALVDDPTIRRCRGYARREGYGGIVVVNLYGYRATRPEKLLDVDDPVGPQNDDALRELLGILGRTGGPLVCAWGATNPKLTAPRVDRLEQLADAANVRELLCLGTTADGHPRHPLYVRGDAPLIPWTRK